MDMEKVKADPKENGTPDRDGRAFGETWLEEARAPVMPADETTETFLEEAAPGNRLTEHRTLADSEPFPKEASADWEGSAERPLAEDAMENPGTFPEEAPAEMETEPGFTAGEEPWEESWDEPEAEAEPSAGEESWDEPEAEAEPSAGEESWDEPEAEAEPSAGEESWDEPEAEAEPSAGEEPGGPGSGGEGADSPAGEPESPVGAAPAELKAGPEKSKKSGSHKGKTAVARAMREAAAYTGGPARRRKGRSGTAKRRLRPGVIAAGVTALVLGVLGIAYCVHARHFEDVFFQRSSINGIDVGGMNLDQAEEAIRKSVEDYSLTVRLMGGRTYTVSGTDFDYTYLPGSQVSSLLKGQNKYLWAKSLFKDSAYEIETPASYNMDKLTKIVTDFEEVRGDDIISPRDACMYYTKGGRFAIIPEVEGNEINPSALAEAVIETAARNSHELNAVDAEGVYRRPAVSSDDAAINERVDHLNALFDVSISYELPDGTGVATYDASDLMLLTGRDGTSSMYNAISDEALEESIRSFVAEMAKTDKITDKLAFQSTDVGTVYYDVESTWGHVLNQDAIVREMKACFAGGCGGERDLTYSFKKNCPESIGDTYLEVDIPTQAVYYYVDGEPIFYCGCVSGREYDRHTPTGIYSIISKSRDIFLEGDFDEEGKPGYRSHVDFWMKFYGGYGLHDASWRSSSEFGSSTYLYDGSHGCVNLSYNSAKYLYENVPIGTKVLIVR